MLIKAVARTRRVHNIAFGRNRRIDMNRLAAGTANWTMVITGCSALEIFNPNAV